MKGLLIANQDAITLPDGWEVKPQDNGWFVVKPDADSTLYALRLIRYEPWRIWVVFGDLAKLRELEGNRAKAFTFNEVRTDPTLADLKQALAASPAISSGSLRYTIAGIDLPRRAEETTTEEVDSAFSGSA